MPEYIIVTLHIHPPTPNTHTHTWILSCGNSHQYCVTRQLLKELSDFLTLSRIVFLSVTFYLKNLKCHEVLIYVYLHCRRKEKISHCLTIADAMCHPGVKGASNFSQLLSIAIEILLQLCDDCHSDVRMIADESLNRVIRVSRWIGFVLQGLSLGPELWKKMELNDGATCDVQLCCCNFHVCQTLMQWLLVLLHIPEVPVIVSAHRPASNIGVFFFYVFPHSLWAKIGWNHKINTAALFHIIFN